MREWIPSKRWDAPFTKSPGKNSLARTSARPLTCQTGGLWRAPYLRLDSLSVDGLVKIFSVHTIYCCPSLDLSVSKLAIYRLLYLGLFYFKHFTIKYATSANVTSECRQRLWWIDDWPVFPSIYQIHPLNQPTIKHNVKSLITSPPKLPHSMPQLEAMERAKYEESKAVRHTSVVNSTSVLRSTHQEAGKSQLSPGMYEDANARRTPVNYSTNSVSRGSPMLGRAPEGKFYRHFIYKLWIRVLSHSLPI